VITPEFSNEFPWISVWRLVKPYANYSVDILKAHWLRPTFAESYRLLRLTLSEELVDVYGWNAPDQWHNWPVAGMRNEPPPCQTKWKTGLQPSAFAILLISIECCLFAFHRLFSSDFGFLCSRSIPNLLLFLHYFLGVGQRALFSQVSPWLKPYCIWSKLEVVLQIRAMCRATSNILQ